MTSVDPIEVRSVPEPLICPRCRKDGILSAQVLHGWTNFSGADVHGGVEVVLCADCDADTTHAAPLITWFHVNGTVDTDNDEEFLTLLTDWAKNVRVPKLDEVALEEEIQVWRRGEL